MPLGVDPYAGLGEEPQCVLGFPAGWYGPVDRDLLRPLRHPIKAYKHWALRRPRVLSYLKKVTQSRRADPIPEGTRVAGRRGTHGVCAKVDFCACSIAATASVKNSSRSA
jgi:hypothetical protein